MSFLLLSVGATVCLAGSSVDKAFNDNIREGDGKLIIGNSNGKIDASSGFIDDTHTINKYGRAESGVETTATDIWDQAEGTPTNQVWDAPTAARVHSIVSSSASDASAGVGARTLRLWGLQDWDTQEVSEDIIMNGTGTVNTTRSYVIIHRMKVLTKGATNVNVGSITATAASDATITAEIKAGIGQTEMAIYGISSLEDMFVSGYYGSINKAQGTAATINYSLLVNPEPDSELINFNRKNTIGVQSTGASHFSHPFNPYLCVPGPAIVKVSGLASIGDVDGSAGFDGYIKVKPTSFDDFVVLKTSTTRHNTAKILQIHDGSLLRLTGQ